MKVCMRQSVSILLVVLYSLSSGAISYGGDQPVSSTRLDRAAAMEKAVQYTGFDLGTVASSTFAEKNELSDSRIIDIPPGIPAAPSDNIWTVRFEDVEVSFHSGDSAFGNFELSTASRDFDVVLDAETGGLVKVVSRYQGPTREGGGTPWDHLEATTAPGIGHFTVGLPKEPPIENFNDVLVWANCANPDAFQQVEAYCIYLVSTSDAETALPSPKDSAAVWWVIEKSYSGEPVVDDDGYLVKVSKPIAVYKLVDLKTNHGWTVVVSGEPILGKGRKRLF